MSKNVTAVILAGGKGTRLRPLTVYTPKPVVPLMNRPFLYYQLGILSRAGVSDITLSLSYQPNKIEDVMGDGAEFGVHLRFITEPNPLGTAGAFRYAVVPDSETSIVLNGDVLTDVDITRVIECHQKAGAEATLVLAPVDDPSRFGLVESAEDGRILRFLEKPDPTEIAELGINTINAGIYLLERSVLDLIPEGQNCSFEYSVFPAILERKMTFNAYVLNGNYWRDIGNPQSYLEAHHDFLDGKIRGFEKPAVPEADIATAATIDERSVRGEECVIKPNAVVRNSVLGPGVHVEEKAVVENSVVWAHTRIASAATVRNAVIGRSCHIGRNVEVGPGTVLGDKASLPDYSKV